jgi:fatty acid-binding protein DegV
MGLIIAVNCVRHSLAALLQKKLNIAKIEVLRISPMLGVHNGPGIVGATVVPMHLMDEIG